MIGIVKENTEKVNGSIDVDSDDDIKLEYTMEDLDRWIEEADQDEREGKLIPYDEAYKEEMRKLEEEWKDKEYVDRWHFLNMKKPLFLFYSLILLLVTVSISSCKKGSLCKKGSSCKKGCDSDCIEHCTIYFKDGTKKEFDIDSKYKLKCKFLHFDSFDIYIDYIYPTQKNEERERYSLGTMRSYCIIIDKKNVTKEGCLKEMNRLAEEIGDGRMVEDRWDEDHYTLSFGSLENVIGYSYRFKNHEKTTRILPPIKYDPEHNDPVYYTIFFKDGTKKEFSINDRYRLTCKMKLANNYFNELPPFWYCCDSEYNHDDDFTGTHVTTFDISLEEISNSFLLNQEDQEDGLREMKRLANDLGDGEVKKHYKWSNGRHYLTGLYISSIKNVTGYSYRWRNCERTIRLF